MTAVIEYGEQPAYLLYQLEKLGVDLKYTSVESEILAADRIILPDCSDIKRALKRLHLLNLFSMLKMLKKPALGIGNGFSLMCDSPHLPNSSGLAFFPLALSLPENCPPLPAKYKAKVTGSVMFLDVENLDGLYFEKFFIPSAMDYNTAVLSDYPEIPAAYKKGNFMGLIFNPEYSGFGGNLMINRFLEI
jgi:glutamine amidotransferase